MYVQQVIRGSFRSRARQSIVLIRSQSSPRTLSESEGVSVHAEVGSSILSVVRAWVRELGLLFWETCPGEEEEDEQGR